MPKTVLLIDDSQTVLAVLGEALRRAGFTVHAESDVFQANRHVHRGKVDLVLLDVQMPLLSGAEICRILKSREETRSVPVLFCSDLPPEELDRLVAEAGAEGFLSKGRPVEELVAEVQRRLA